MLRQNLSLLEVSTRAQGFSDITAALNREIGLSGLDLGLVTLVCQHTSCSLTINENADPRVLEDLAAYLRALVPEEGFRALSGEGERRRYAHADEGPDDMPAHIRTALTATTLQLSFQAGRLVLGTWQAVYLWEHRARGQRRRLSLHLIGSEAA
ncbi:MAG: secondary thiamine-phosphate synthase enzyme YjbQ [Cyanobacteria bacterium J06638_7]